MLPSALLLAWFSVALWFSRTGRLDSIPSAQLLAVGMACPIVGFVGMTAASPAFRNWTGRISLRALTLLQTPRVLGGSYILFCVRTGLVRGTFGWPTGVSDVAIGLSAPIVAHFLISKTGEPRHGLLSWQAFSLAWLLISSLSGILTSPESLSRFPLNLVPIFFGPLMIFLQLIGIRRATHSA